MHRGGYRTRNGPILADSELRGLTQRPALTLGDDVDQGALLRITVTGSRRQEASDFWRSFWIWIQYSTVANRVLAASAQPEHSGSKSRHGRRPPG